MPVSLPAKSAPQIPVLGPVVWGLAVWLASGFALASAGFAQSARDFGGYPGYTGPRYQGHTTEALYVRAEDGTRLAIDVHLPKGLPGNAKIPTVIKTTRYWRAISLRWPASLFDRDDFVEFFTGHGYAVVKLDVRGTGASFGSWPISYTPQEMRDAGHDAGTFARIPAEGDPVITVERNLVHASYLELPVVARRGNGTNREGERVP
jgi:hypothetical protein